MRNDGRFLPKQKSLNSLIVYPSFKKHFHVSENIP